MPRGSPTSMPRGLADLIVSGGLRPRDRHERRWERALRGSGAELARALQQNGLALATRHRDARLHLWRARLLLAAAPGGETRRRPDLARLAACHLRAAAARAPTDARVLALAGDALWELGIDLASLALRDEGLSLLRRALGITGLRVAA
jgi:hypothetical protein